MEQEQRRFVQKIELVDIYLKENRSICNVFPKSANPETIKLNNEFKLGHKLSEDNAIFACFVGIEIKGTDVNDESKSLFLMSCIYALIYRVSGFDGRITKNLIDHFLRSTAIFNAYPYLREYIRSQSMKMGLEPIVLPLYKQEPQFWNTPIPGGGKPTSRKGR